MIKGALYKKRTDENNAYGYDFIKVMDVKISRTIEWSPTSDRDDKEYEYFWRSMPRGKIHNITQNDYDILLYAYNTEKRENEVEKDLMTVDQEEFWECICSCYDLVSLDET